MDASNSLETRLGLSLDDLIKQQQQAKKKENGERAARPKSKKTKTGSSSAPKVLKGTGGVMKAMKAGRRLGGRRAPLQVAAAVTKTKTKQGPQGKSTATKSSKSAINVELRTKADAVAAVKAMQPIMEKAQKILAKPDGGKKKASGSSKNKGRRANTDVVMQGTGGGSGRRSRSGNRRK